MALFCRIILIPVLILYFHFRLKGLKLKIKDIRLNNIWLIVKDLVYMFILYFTFAKVLYYFFPNLP